MPPFFPSGDERLDPTCLVMLLLRPQPLVRALLVASLVGIGPLLTVCMLTGSAISLAHGAATYATAVPAVVLGLLTSRKGRDLAVLSGLVDAMSNGSYPVGFTQLALTAMALGGLPRFWSPSLTMPMTAMGGVRSYPSDDQSAQGTDAGVQVKTPAGSIHLPLGGGAHRAHRPAPGFGAQCVHTSQDLPGTRR